MPLSPKRIPRKPIPDSVHEFRTKHWPAIEALEKMESGRTITRELWAIIVASKKKNSPELAKRQANAILRKFTMITDKVMESNEARATAGDSWAQTYRMVHEHYWKSLPVAVRREIITQMIEQRRKDRAEKKQAQ